METVPGLSALVHRGGGVAVELGGHTHEFAAAVDGTGRAALWSRPIKRAHQMIAHVFEDLPMRRPTGLRLVRLGAGWAHRIGLRGYTTVALVSPHRRRVDLSEEVTEALGAYSRVSQAVGRRVAGLQWAVCPIKDRAVAIGDAALAHDPVSGQGIRFAVSSAMAAASVIRTWLRSPQDGATPTEFYADFVNTERRRHLRFMESLYGLPLGTYDGRSPATGHSRASRSIFTVQ